LLPTAAALNGVRNICNTFAPHISLEGAATKLGARNQTSLPNTQTQDQVVCLTAMLPLYMPTVAPLGGSLGPNIWHGSSGLHPNKQAARSANKGPCLSTALLLLNVLFSAQAAGLVQMDP
jgi:hypothetical protein